MDKILLDITAIELLQKFGAGSHKPGSGSAAAFQGMLSAKLLITVIDLTVKKPNYSKFAPQFSTYNYEINNRIFPQLSDFFQADAIQFGKTIDARKLRDKELNVIKKNQIGRNALAELKISIDIPLKIAELCCELVQISGYTFDNGFKAARGDSQVALSSAISGIAGCISIINLNLLSFGSDEFNYTQSVLKNVNTLRLKLNEYNILSNDKIKTLENEIYNKSVFYEKVSNFIINAKKSKYKTNSEIETIAINFQNLIWLNRKFIFPDTFESINKLDILQVEVAFRKVLTYKFEKSEIIEIVDNENNYTEIAGLINQDEKIVLISKEQKLNVQNFTAAHELGHALLHKQSVLHRDKPSDGSSINKNVAKEEIEADKFATFFLMPKKLILEVFTSLFLTTKFIINEESAFNLIKESSPSLVRTKYKNLRGLTLKLASAERYENNSFETISKIFKVSELAMAIRLEELNLVEF